MQARLLITFLFIDVSILVGLLMAIFASPGFRDYISLGAATVALLALLQSWLSSSAATTNANLAQMNEERKRYGWSIVLHPDGGHYVLRNTGTLTARDVRLVIPDQFGHAAFLQHDGDAGPVIPPNQSKAFRAEFPWSSRGTEIQVDWLPDSEEARQSFNDVVQPTPDRVAEFQSKVRQRLDEESADSLAMARRHAAECRTLLTDLAHAWASYQAEPNLSNKIRVQGIVGALPTNFAREIGYQVDVPRDFWGDHQWPPEVWVPENSDDQALLRDNAAMIELIWNLRQVQIPVFVEPDLSQPPDPWPRIERAVYGFRDLVRGRESGEREFHAGERDRERRAEADRRFREMNSRTSFESGH